ncbi:MAG: ABC transporter ATP-binding protein, partial [Acidimicrobiales bacterium]
GLDLGGREDLVSRLGQVAAQAERAPTVLVTHHVEEIPEGTTHALLLRSARTIHQGPIDEALTGASLSDAFGLSLELERRDHRWSARIAPHTT